MAENDWLLSPKNYPHFDATISRDNIDALVRNPIAVAANKFYPFMRYTQSWQPFRSKSTGKPSKKERPIRFASRRDAYIFSYYRHLLSTEYEKLLQVEGIDGSVIAYRRIRGPDGGGKCNIEFARDAFHHIQRFGGCAVVALDISSFFESLDHAELERQWQRVIQTSVLPPDHASVFRNITRYSVVEREDVYERLGYLKWQVVNGTVRLVPTVPFADMPKKLCSNRDSARRYVVTAAK